MKRLLVVAAHPDDEVLGCGGIIARALQGGGEVRILILTEGCSAQYPRQPEMAAQKERESRRALLELQRGEHAGAATDPKSVGISLRISMKGCGFQELALHTLETSRVVAPIAEQLREWHPETVLVHHSGDLNADHTICHTAARVACRPTPEYAPRLLSYETLSSTEWGVERFSPNVFVPLRPAQLEAKKNALRAYQSEVRPWPHPRSPEGVEVLARRRGMQCGADFAEAFQLIWQRWDDPGH